MSGTQNRPQQIQTITGQTRRNHENKYTKKREGTEILSGAIQYLSKYIEKLSVQADILRNLLKTPKEWTWTDEHTKAFNSLKRLITQLPCLA